ncbi:MAG: hypothetical protein ACREPF_03935 [Rhodanobacteraceae bacterium]
MNERSVLQAAASLPLANPVQAMREVEQLLDGLLATTLRSGERSAALAHLDGPIEALCSGAVEALAAERHPLQPAAAERAALAQQLEWKLAWNDALALHELCAPVGGLSRYRRRAAAAVCADGLAHASRVLLWAYRQYRTPPPGAWRLVHTLYAVAAGFGIADEPGGPASGASCASARNAYAEALLLGMGNPYRFSAGELDETCLIIGCVAGLCVLADSNAAGVRVDTEVDDGPRCVASERVVGAVDTLVLSVQPVLRALDALIAQAGQTGAVIHLTHPDGGIVATSAAFLRRLTAGWIAVARSCARLPASHTLELAVGMPAVHYALAGDVDFATFMARAHAETGDAAPHVLDAWPAAAEAPPKLRAEVRNQGEGGYRLRVQASGTARLRIGEVVAVAPTGDEPYERDWMVGVIRWLRLDGEHAWLGIELLHRVTRAAGLHLLTDAGGATVPQRAVELPGHAGSKKLALLVPRGFPVGATMAEVLLPSLAFDWTTRATTDVWRFEGAEPLGPACVRVTLGPDDQAEAAKREGGA